MLRDVYERPGSKNKVLVLNYHAQKARYVLSSSL